MPAPITDNVAGHRSKYELLAAHLPAHAVGDAYVGDTDPIKTGYYELELIRGHTSIEQAALVDIGCGVGRLARHLIHEPVASYLGLDIIPEIIESARSVARDDRRFEFKIVRDCQLPLADRSATIVVGFSVITHLLDEEIYEYFREAKRVLDRGGLAIFTFLDFDLPAHQALFFKHAGQYRDSHGDMLKFSTKRQLKVFGKTAGFARVKFISAWTRMRYSRATSPVFDTKTRARKFEFGQSICLLRA